MGLLDSTIVNLQRIAGDIIQQPANAVDQAIAQTQSGIQSGLGVLGGASLLGMGGPTGDVGPEGVTNIIVRTEGTPMRQRGVAPVRDLSNFAGGFWSGGNGQFATRTTVERLEIATGQVTISSRMPGSPHLMNSEINAAKKVFRNVAALNKRMPRKTVKESEVTKLKNAAVAAATAAVSCPPRAITCKE